MESLENPMSSPIPLPGDLAQQVDRALDEDIGRGDLTAALIPSRTTARASVITRESAVLCGSPYVDAVFARLDPAVRIDWQAAEGAAVAPNQVLFKIAGPARALLTGERTALNFLQLLSGTATAAHAYAQRLEGTRCRVLDTRKTIPGLRSAQKYAVRVGGGQNHRIGLFDGILIKENHIMAAGSIAQAVAAATATGRRVPIEVEVENLDELQQAITAGADIAMLDDFSLPAMSDAVLLNRRAPRPLKLEASGGVTLETIRQIAETGVDYVSVGSITKHVRATDLSMRFEWPTPAGQPLHVQ
jgi:nicotinate-nucleotide pyrophosphorylase (carboxylating)